MKAIVLALALLASACANNNPAQSAAWSRWAVHCHESSCVATLRLTDAGWPNKHILCDSTGCYCLQVTTQTRCWHAVELSAAGVQQAYDNGCCRGINQ